MDIHANQTCINNYFDYIYNYFIFVTKGDSAFCQSSPALPLYSKYFPLFSEPYILLPPHPKTPFYEWKTPAKEAFYAEIDCYLLLNNHNSNVKNVCDPLGPEILRRIPFLLTRSHGATQHFRVHVVSLNPELPIKISNNHLTRARLRKKIAIKLVRRI